MADKEEFTFRAGSVYELPLDKSLNMLQRSYALNIRIYSTSTFLENDSVCCA